MFCYFLCNVIYYSTVLYNSYIKSINYFLIVPILLCNNIKNLIDYYYFTIIAIYITYLVLHLAFVFSVICEYIDVTYIQYDVWYLDY